MSSSAKEEYNQIADTYHKDKSSAWRVHVEQHTLVGLVQRQVSGVAGKKVLDVACGSGIYSRIFASMGAETVIGIDLSEEMIRLAQEHRNKEDDGKISYFVADALELADPDTDNAAVAEILRHGPFDIITSAFLLNYAADEETLVSMFRALSNVLTPDGVIVGVNNSPFDDKLPFRWTRSHGVQKTAPGYRDGDSLEPGAPVVYELVDTSSPDLPTVGSFTNYWLSPEAHERAAFKAGLDLQWHPLTHDGGPTPDGSSPEDFYREWLAPTPDGADCETGPPPVVAFTATRLSAGAH